jgi:hypothetical protein
MFYLPPSSLDDLSLSLLLSFFFFLFLFGGGGVVPFFIMKIHITAQVCGLIERILKKLPKKKKREDEVAMIGY